MIRLKWEDKCMLIPPSVFVDTLFPPHNRTHSLAFYPILSDAFHFSSSYE